MDYYSILKQNRKKPVVTINDSNIIEGLRSINYGQEYIKKIIPHRDPLLLLDNIIGVSIIKGEEFIVGTRFISKDDPVFKGHFPEYPVYPGTFQLEMGGQLGLCLAHFVFNNTMEITDEATMVNARATKVLGALFLEPLFPDKTALVISKRVEYDGYFGTVLSQIISDDKVCTVSIAEVIFLDDE